MRLVGLNRVGTGAVLARDVLTGRHGGVPLLTRGTRLDGRLLDALRRSGVNAVYVDDELGEGIEVPFAVSEEIRVVASEGLERAFDRVGQGLGPGVCAAMTNDEVAEFAAVAQLIADELAGCGDAVLAFQDLAAADEYTLQHSIDVTALGLLVGRRYLNREGWRDFRGRARFDGHEKRLVQLGLGLILHDIGKLLVPTGVLNKPDRLETEEWDLVRLHPQAGIDMLSPTSVSPLARAVVRSHHERWDGSGYPDGASGSGIHQFARIAAVADVYDAVTSERSYSRAWSAQAGWQLIVEGAGTSFDPDVVAAFRCVVAPYPPGAEIVLDDGRRGVVSRVEPERLEQPLVRIGWDERGRAVEPYEIELDALPAVAARAA
jgi:HD-GYP domain-containing protein (c-di-GMP phosphodiesterase class II)